jgi:hypothetical protein
MYTAPYSVDETKKPHWSDTTAYTSQGICDTVPTLHAHLGDLAAKY